MKDGIFTKNPLLRLGLGICPAIAVTGYAMNALGMGIVTCCVLICSALVCTLLSGVVSESGRLPTFLMVSAAFATVAQLILQAYFPALNAALGIFVPLLAVNCIMLGRADEICEMGVGSALMEAIGMGIGYIYAITLLGVIREFLSYGSIFGARILNTYSPLVVAALPAGGFILLGLLMGLFNCIWGKKGDEEAAK